jgi:purine-nucleoside phosphorylase
MTAVIDATELPLALAESVDAIRQKSGISMIDAGIILGSGLGEFAERLQNSVSIPYSEIPHFGESKVEGHAGNLVIGELMPGFRIVCMQGRFHFYEGHPMSTVTYPTRVLRNLGIKNLVVTNAAGGINTSFEPGTLMMISDHINLMGVNPLSGPHHVMMGARFPDMSEAYSKELRALLTEVASAQGTKLAEGVYAGLSGPTYETPAEIRMLRTLGADAVGMSTIPEVVTASQLEIPVLGISCITNLAAGVSPHKLSHAEVMETAERVKQQFMNLLSGFFAKLAEQK